MFIKITCRRSTAHEPAFVHTFSLQQHTTRATTDPLVTAVHTHGVNCLQSPANSHCAPPERVRRASRLFAERQYNRRPTRADSGKRLQPGSSGWSAVATVASCPHRTARLLAVLVSTMTSEQCTPTSHCTELVSGPFGRWQLARLNVVTGGWLRLAKCALCPLDPHA